MKYSADKQENFTVLSIQEDNLNSVLAPDLKSELVILKNEGVKNLIMDLENVKFVDSSGLSSILTANRLWGENGSFVLTGIKSESIQKLIEISRLQDVFNIIPTVQESIDFVMLEELAKQIGAEDDSATDN